MTPAARGSLWTVVWQQRAGVLKVPHRVSEAGLEILLGCCLDLTPMFRLVPSDYIPPLPVCHKRTLLTGFRQFCV